MYDCFVASLKYLFSINEHLNIYFSTPYIIISCMSKIPLNQAIQRHIIRSDITASKPSFIKIGIKVLAILLIIDI